LNTTHEEKSREEKNNEKHTRSFEQKETLTGKNKQERITGLRIQNF